MSMIAQIAFWVSAVAVAATYIVYPVSIALIGASRRRHTKPDQPPEITPSVSVVVSAYNEAKVIREKINNLLALDYPAEKLQVLIISDASDDGTDGIVRSLEDPRVLLCRQETRRGKSSGLTRFVPRASGEILVFSDANSMYHPMAVRRLVRHFSDPSVGYVVGEQRYAENGLTVAQSEATYERYEALIKEHESRVGSVVGGDGAIYAIRANLFRPLRADDISDLVNPLQIVVQGYRGVFEREAFCYENAAADYRGEFRRKARIVNRSLLGVMRHAQALNPARVGWFAYQLLLHKVVRWLVPFFLLLALVSSAWLAIHGSSIYIGMFLGQATVYVLGLLHFLPWLRSLRCVFLPYYFVVVNLAAAVGVISCLAGTRITIWTPERVRNSAPRRSGVAIGAITILGFLFAFAYFMLGWAGVYWISFALMAYTYAGYQLLVSTLALFRKRTLRETVCSAVLTNNNSRPHSELPLVSVIIPAYNEESVIRAKLENSLSMDYPAERLEIIVASDGSSDRTVEIAQQFQARHVRLLDFSERRGKAAVLNDAVCASRGSVLCLTDANVLCRRDALLRLVERLQDHSVGAVSAEVRLASEQANYGSGEELYYYLERLVQRSESRLGSMIGLDGGMYVIRREYFEPLRNDTILDDFTTAMQVMRSGKRIVYESRAVASENGTATALEEFRRRVRVSAGSVQLLLRGPLATLAQPVEVWKFVSHKLLRWMSPLWLVTFLVSGIMLWNIALAYRVAGAAQFIFYAISLLAGISVSFRRTKLGGVPFYFTMSHVAIAVGMVLGLLNRQKVTWAKADRGMPTLEHEVAIASSAGLTPVGTHRSTSSSAGPVPAGTHLSASSSAAPVPAGTHLSATSEAH